MNIFLFNLLKSITFSFVNGGAHQRRKFCLELDQFKSVVNLHINECKTSGDIRISFDNQQCPHSSVGTKCKNIAPKEATMILSKIMDVEGSSSWEEKFIISHEIGHALGLLHEHQSPGRVSWLNFKEKGTELLSLLIIGLIKGPRNLRLLRKMAWVGSSNRA